MRAQIAFSHWWLARFRYGPMEWLWRGFTYRQVPPLRRDGAAGRGADPGRLSGYFAGTSSMRRTAAASTRARVYSSGKYSPFSHIGARSR